VVVNPFGFALTPFARIWFAPAAPTAPATPATAEAVP
jgi:hypothetical protein